MKKRFNIDVDTGVDHADEGPWRSYQLVTEGNNIDELLDYAYMELQKMMKNVQRNNLKLLGEA